MHSLPDLSSAMKAQSLFKKNSGKFILTVDFLYTCTCKCVLVRIMSIGWQNTLRTKEYSRHHVSSCNHLIAFLVEKNIIGFALYVSEPALGLPPDCFTEILL